MVQQVNLASTEYPKGVNEFLKAGLTMLPSVAVKPFRVKESPVQFECKVREVIETGNAGGAGNLVVCEILMIHVDDDILDENGTIDPNKIQLVGRLGGDHYCEAFGAAIFEVEKPLAKLGIGVDQLPANIRLSDILSGNDLGQLANVEKLPEGEVIEKSKELLQGKTESEIHFMAKKLISEGKVEDALAYLLCIEH